MEDSGLRDAGCQPSNTLPGGWSHLCIPAEVPVISFSINLTELKCHASSRSPSFRSCLAAFSREAIPPPPCPPPQNSLSRPSSPPPSRSEQPPNLVTVGPHGLLWETSVDVRIPLRGLEEDSCCISNLPHDCGGIGVISLHEGKQNNPEICASSTDSMSKSWVNATIE